MTKSYSLVISLVRKNLNLINLKFSLFGRVTMKKKVEKPFPEKKDYYRDHSKLGRDLIKRKNDRLKSLLEDKRPDKY